MTAPATRTLPPLSDQRPGIVVDAAKAPEWVLRWSAGSGRAVRTRPAAAPFDNPAAPNAVDAFDAPSVADPVDVARTGDSVLVVRAQAFPARRPLVVAALRRLPEDAAVLADALDAALHLGGSLTVVHGVPVSFGERSVGLAEALRRGEDLLHDARALVEAAARDRPAVPFATRLVRAWPHELVGEHLDADLLVVGGPRVGSAGGTGLVAATAVRHAPCPVLLVTRPTAAGPSDEPRAGVTAPFPTPRAAAER